MRISNAVWGLVLTGAALGCDVTGPDACPTDARPALSVKVLDAQTGAPLADSATVIARDGEYEETLRECDLTITRCGAYERPGTYAVVVSHPRYQLWIRDRVVAGEGSCNVQTQNLTAELQPR